jgi:uncharacterized protein with PIN domain
MVVDTSAIVAILEQEPEGERFTLAKQLGEPLLFKGGDFAVTDIPRAL